MLCWVHFPTAATAICLKQTDELVDCVSSVLGLYEQEKSTIPQKCI